MANEKRLVDANVLIRDLTAMKSVYDAIALDGMIKALNEAPTVDAMEVVHGRWGRHNVDGTDMFGEPTEIVFACNCSVCGRDGRSETPYCPNCGAKMDGGKDD